MLPTLKCANRAAAAAAVAYHYQDDDARRYRVTLTRKYVTRVAAQPLPRRNWTEEAVESHIGKVSATRNTKGRVKNANWRLGIHRCWGGKGNKE